MVESDARANQKHLINFTWADVEQDTLFYLISHLDHQMNYCLLHFLLRQCLHLASTILHFFLM